MNEERPLFILAGNKSYENRGCEAIARGTVKILREFFKNPLFICLSHFESREQCENQCIHERDAAIVHLTTQRLNKKKVIQNFWRQKTWLYVYRHLFHPSALKYQVYSEMLPYLNNATAVLSVGGDNYSLDYGIPTHFTDLDNIVLEKQRVMVIWGASVGPFNRNPDYEEYMGSHLREIDGIFARESATIEYLNSIGVIENVYSVADPAFLMDPVRPHEIENDLPIDSEAIGINLSPLMAKYVTGGDLEAWRDMAASIIEDLAQKTDMPIYLIPHVTSQASNDHIFMLQAFTHIKNKYNITIVSPKYNAAEMKWIISQMAIFAGARTHSTIAALSSSVPTLSFAYSIKARGINKDIFGHNGYCLEPKYLNAKTISCQVNSMLNDSANIRRELEDQIPRIQNASLGAGMKLKYLIEEN